MIAWRAQEQRQLIDGAAALDVTLQPAQAESLSTLLDELLRWNRAYNLTAIHERERMVTHHLLDSLAASPWLRGPTIADVGTGAGLPGLPLAIVHPGWQFTLIDAAAKKLQFVEHAARRLGLRNVTTLHARVETLRPSPGFACVVARALAALPDLCAGVAALCAPGGELVALKGRYPAAELAALPPPWQLLECRAVQVPALNAERHLIRLAPSRPAPAGHAAADSPAGSAH